MEREYIWLDTQEKNTYAEFMDKFDFHGGKALLKITADYRYAAFVNGQLVGNAQYADIPEYKTFSEYDVTKYVKEGENVLLVKAFHMGEEYSVCRVMTPCVSYEIVADGARACASSKNTLCRKDCRYAAGDLFSRQAGDGYNYSFTAKENAWVPCTVVKPDFKEFPKPIKNTRLDSKKDCVVIAQGAYRLNGGETTAEKMQKAFLSTLPLHEMTGVRKLGATPFPLSFRCKTEGDGLFILGDLGCECAGFPFFDIVCEEDAVAYLGWGEHLADLRPRVKIEYRNFAIEIQLKKGENHFADYLRRIGGRYLWLFIENKSAVLNAFGLTEELYPLQKPEKDFGDELLNKIYETGRRTLELCMHEHYEDCPWREQALYGMDSRNQMLYGYGAFHEYEFPRATLSLMGKCMREDGLSFLCPPSTLNLVIPSFSAYWILAVCDNVKADFQLDFVKEILPSVEKCLKAFQKKTRNKVLNRFGEKEYWNFHEWSKGLEGAPTFRDYEIEEYPDGLLTAVVYRAAKGASEIEKAVGNEKLATELIDWANELAEGLHTFYDEEKGLFASYVKEGERFGYHEYTQALMLSTGVLDKAKQERICDVLTKGHSELTPTTFAGLPIKYEALSACSNAAEYIKKDICEKFGAMLFKGATSYWETADGEEDFSGAGSLCHGWSAAACYALDALYKVQIEK